MARPLWSSDSDRRETALLVAVQKRDQHERDVHDSLEELALLSATAGAEVVDQVVCRQMAIHPATFIGRGKTEEIARQVRDREITTVVFDDDLSPAQGRNLGRLIEAKIIDRTQLILDIFAQHAHTKEGRLQIELAQYQYLLPRLRHMWAHLERQRGGIGLRGPGEQQLEVDRRRVQNKMLRIRDALEHVRKHRAEQRRGRRRHGWALLTFVGYTNAGKSTLLNSLTGADVLAYDKLFATLDPVTRQLRLPNHQPVLVTDTVGFIRKLPHHLVESFKATLEEVNEADLLIHVIDASHPSVDRQIDAVSVVLRELGADQKPVLSVLNKMDLGSARAQCGRLLARLGRAVPVSALAGEGLDLLRDELADFLKSRTARVQMRLPASEGKLLAAVRSSGKVFAETYGEDGSALVEASVPGRLYGRCLPFLVPEKRANRRRPAKKTAAPREDIG
ncbi:MAG: GTPase HflX [Verrucomicrobiota bacterium]